MKAGSLAAACALAALATAGTGAATAAGTGARVAEGAAQPAFSHAEWVELVRLYARGGRAQAVARLGAWSERDLARQLASVEQATRAAERCPSCPTSLESVPLQAAVMLHWDRDRDEQPSQTPAGVEQLRRCPGPLATLAGRFARLLARNPTTADFARRFFRMVVVSCQWDACFDAAERWAGEAIELFPRDAELLLARGSVREEAAVLGAEAPGLLAADTAAGVEALAASVRREALERARRDLRDAIAAGPGLALARVRLGRVLWRLGEPEPAKVELEAALRSLADPDHAYLAHLFLGRVHEDAGRLADALSEYRQAAGIHPSALSVAVALSHALQLEGDAEAARDALRHGLRSAGQRRERDPHWDYLVVNATDLAELREELHRESLE